MAVLVDSSVWISASSPRNKECLLLRRLLEGDELICYIAPIQVEVCQGARSEAEFHRLWEGFLGLNRLEIEDRHWGLSAWNYLKARQSGIGASTIDCLIATVAKETRVALWSLDRDFRRLQPVIGFESYRP
jgi:predicted nucleic acid-binding protein